MVVLKKSTIAMFSNRPDLLSLWMIVLKEIKELLIKFFIYKGIYGWQGLKIALEKEGYKVNVKDLIIFYSDYELNENLLETLQFFSLKLK